MQVKIKRLSLSGLRGVKENVVLPLNEKSILIYGDNGTGKSSISDSIEWFYTDCVSHLSSIEIDMKDAIRNACIDKSVPSTANLVFNRPNLECEKTMTFKKGKLSCEFSNSSAEFKSYQAHSEKENLILRHQFLRDFVGQAKGEKLKYLSDIIGFSEVTKVKEVLKKSYNSIKTELRNQNYETQISTQKQTLIVKIGAALSREENFFDQINKIISDKELGITIKTLNDIDKVLDKLRNPFNTKAVNDISFLENCISIISNLMNEIQFLHVEYQKYHVEFQTIANDVTVSSPANSTF